MSGKWISDVDRHAQQAGHPPDLERANDLVGRWSTGPALEHGGGEIGLCALRSHQRQVAAGTFQRAVQVASDGGLDDARSRLTDLYAGILGAVDLVSQEQAIEVAPRETAVAGRAALDGR
jgi:hypothetical protein